MRSLTSFTRLIPGIAFVFYGAYLMFEIVDQRRGFEEVKAIVTGFHFHGINSSALHPTVVFVYHGDSVTRRLGPADPMPEKGQIVNVSFPVGEPDQAEIQPVEWYWAGFITLAGFWWLGTLVLVRKLDTQKIAERMPRSRPKRDFALPGLLLFSSLSLLLIWMTYYFTKNKLDHPDNSTEWGGLIGLGFLAFLFTTMCTLSWWGRWIEGGTIKVDAEFTRLTGPEVHRSEQAERDLVPPKLPWPLRMIARPVKWLVAATKKYPRLTKAAGVLLVLTGIERSRWERDPDEESSVDEDDTINEENEQDQKRSDA